VGRRKTRRPGAIAIAPGSGLGTARRCTCWPTPDDTGPCTPQTCDGRCLACRLHGRPFYGSGDLQYLEHGTGPLAAELERLWRAKGTMRAALPNKGAVMIVVAGGLCRGERLGWRHAGPRFVR
jgi:hypothetical protein